MVLRVYGADVTLEGEGGRGAEDEGRLRRGVLEGLCRAHRVPGHPDAVPGGSHVRHLQFGPQIATAFGLGVGKSAILGESVLSLFFLVGSLPAMFWLNSMGRRPLLIRSLF